MAKIDTTKIEGYENMSPEQKVAALEAHEFPNPDYKGFVKKEVFDRTTSELAETKRKYNALLSEEEQAKNQRDEEHQALLNKVAAMEKNETISKHKASYLAMGYSEEHATKAATALAEGKTDEVFAIQKEHLTAHDSALKADLLKGTPTPPPGAGNGGTGTDYNKLALEAQANGDYTTAAYYLRLAQETPTTT